MEYEIDSKTGERRVKQLQPPQSPAAAISAEDMAKLDDMSRGELIALIRRVSGAIWGIGMLDEDRTAEAMMLKLAINGLTTQDTREALANISQWLDRKKGKAIQRVDQRIEHTGKLSTGEMTNEQLLATLANASASGLLPGGMKLIGGDLVVDAAYQEVNNQDVVPVP